MPKPLQAAPSSKDRRIERTRRALTVALLELMSERGWDEVDVLSLCERADVGRSTFYQHFPNKEALLQASFAGLKAGLLERAAVGGGRARPLAFLPALLAHVHESQDLFRALLVRRSGHYVQDRFRDVLVELFLAAEPATGARAWPVAARARFLSGALFELLVWWLGANRPHRPDEIEALYRAWSSAVLEVPLPLRVNQQALPSRLLPTPAARSKNGAPSPPSKETNP